MAEFLNEPKLSEKEKEWMLNVAKPLLKKNAIVAVRQKLNDDSSFSIVGNSQVRIADFLLYHMGEEAYFRNSDFVLGQEFFNDDNLLSIQIPSNVKFIGPSAFNDCYNVVEIDLPDSVEKIGWGAFCDCRRLQKIKIPSKLSVITDEMFYRCWEFPSKMDGLGRWVIVIPDAVKEIGRAAFRDCVFDCVVVPEGCKIHPDAFDRNVQIIKK